MRRLVMTAAVALALVLVAPPVAAHAPGSPPITANGSFVLTPENTNNSTYHAYISKLGVPPGPGDTLRFSWSANGGLGPEIYFEIHAHPGNVGYVRYHEALADRVDGSWSVPGTDLYMILWQNPNAIRENVTYAFTLFPPSPDLSIYIVFPLILGAFGFIVWIARRRPRRPKP